MKINTSKSNIMLFNRAKKHDFQPEYAFSDGQKLNVLEETRLLGIQLTTDLKWNSNTKSVCKKAMSKIWLLRRTKIINLKPQIILEYYLTEIRVLAEQGVPIWNSGLTVQLIRDLERIQKVALKIILADKYETYENACKTFNLKKCLTEDCQYQPTMQLNYLRVIVVLNSSLMQIKRPTKDMETGLLLKRCHGQEDVIMRPIITCQDWLI